MSRSIRRPASLVDASRTPLTVTVGLLVLILLAGCGGETRRAETMTVTQGAVLSPVQPPSPAGQQLVATQVTDPQRRAYIARVDRVCVRLDRERNTARERVANSPNAREQATAYQDMISLGDWQLRTIEAVPAPAHDRVALRTNVFDVIDRQLAIRRQMRAALAVADIPRLQVLRQELDDLTRSLGAFARGYGFRACGEE